MLNLNLGKPLPSINFILLLLFLSPKLTVAQLKEKDTVEMLVDAAREVVGLKLFVHYDKNVYLPNEKIWFTAYLNNKIQLSDTLLLSVLLVNPKNKQILYSKKFPFLGSISSGSLSVPEDLGAGQYILLAYPGLLSDGKPATTFHQTLTIKRAEINEKANEMPRMAKPQKDTSLSATFNFYPEGGALVEGLPSIIGWEALDQFGRPLKLKALLLKDGMPIDTVSSNDFGFGKFILSPSSAHKFQLQSIELGISGYADLPKAIHQAVVITIPKASANDTLQIRLANNLGTKLHLVVHNNYKVFHVFPNLSVGNFRNFRIPLHKLPKGLASITVFGEDFTPLAERVFYAHYDKPESIQITIDSTYKKRNEVEFQLALQSPIDSAANVSIGVVRSNRISRRVFNDIQKYQFLKQELNTPPAPMLGTNQKGYTEDIMLIKGWTRYFLNNARKKLIEPIEQLNGTVTKKNKTITKPISLTLMSNKSLFQIETDSLGGFKLANHQLIVEDEKFANLFTLGKYENEIDIQIADPYQNHNQLLTNSLPTFLESPGHDKFENEQLVALTEGTIKLNKVEIKGRQANEISPVYYKNFKKNDCGDYVCRFDFLNCPIPGHDLNPKMPVKGVVYSQFLPGSNRSIKVKYTGCESKRNVTKINGANMNKEFYGYNMEEFKTGEALNASTLFWKPQILLNKHDKLLLHFFTGDEAGSFDIIIQGTTANGPIYAEKSFKVDPN